MHGATFETPAIGRGFCLGAGVSWDSPFHLEPHNLAFRVKTNFSGCDMIAPVGICEEGLCAI